MHHTPFEIVAIEILLLVLVSAICSGLNIAVMSLDMSDLRRKAKLGNRQAKRVLPLRKNTHLILASILLTNVAAVSASSLVLDQYFIGIVAGLISTVIIVIFGEIFPQALFSKNPLAWTSFFSPVLKVMIIITYPLSKPLQLLLDTLFPYTRSRLQSRQELGLLINEHLSNDNSELDEDEVVIMRGALRLSEKRVREIMTDIRHTYWLTLDTELTGEKIDELKAEGYSRIPVFDRELTRCHGVVLMKNLVDIDFDERVMQVAELPLHPVKSIGSMTALDTTFRKFIAAGTHLMPVEKDDVIIGVITIEDLIEEILGHEIEDETDRQKLQKMARDN
jgi:metal transporter CNNM